jgi:hypothetical protein
MEDFKSTEIDPAYAKAWGRLATAQEVHLLFCKQSSAADSIKALGDVGLAIFSWQKAVNVFQSSNLTANEKTQKAQYEAGLKKARAGQKNPQNPIVMREPKELPFHIAEKMLPELKAAGHSRAQSSAWVIGCAYEVSGCATSNTYMRLPSTLRTGRRAFPSWRKR